MRTNGLGLCRTAMLLLLAGCNGASPTAPPAAPPAQSPPPGTRYGVVTGNVVDPNGQCIIGAVVEVLDGTRAGASAIQTACQSPWDYGDDGYSFRDLSPDTNVWLRASKEGYESKEMAVLASSTAWSQSNFVLEPKK